MLWQLATPAEMLRNVLEGQVPVVLVVVSLVAKVQYSTGINLIMFSGLKLP